MPDDVYGVPEPVQPISPMMEDDEEADEMEAAMGAVQPGKLDSTTSPYLYQPQPTDPYQTLASDEDEEAHDTDELIPGTNKYYH